MSKKLFEAFEPISAKTWKQKIQYDLKGADYNKTLVWKSREGIDVKPFYHSDDFEAFQNPSATNSNEWKIAQSFEVSNVEDTNIKAREAIERGAEALVFHIASKTVDCNVFLQNIDITTIPVYLKLDGLLEKDISETIHLYQNELTSNKQLVILIDIIGHLANTGNWFKSLKEDHSYFENIIKNTGQLYIDMSLYQNAGATMIQQLAYGLAHANEYLNHLETVLDANAKQLLQVTFHVSVGSNYFFEIAKLRALRQLWETLAKEYGVNMKCKIMASPSLRNKTIYDYNTNMLRTTTECMSAVLGGADIVINTPYDAVYHHPNEFGDRISRNQLLILKNESYFSTVSNPADGSYYIESLTSEMANKALDVFKSIEIAGGFLKQLKEGTVQRKIKESATHEQADFDEGKIVLLGTNKHPNPQDKMKLELEKSPFLEKKKRKTLIEPIVELRLSEKLEMNRLKQE